jgi:protein phosphatase
MNITIPLPSLILLIGPAGSGKSTFARKHFRPTEVLSSDFFRGLVCDDETSQGATEAAFEVLHLVVDKRLAAGRLAVVDATNVLAASRRPLLELARRHHLFAMAVVFDLPEDACVANDLKRPGRAVGRDIVARHVAQLQQALPEMQAEGFYRIHMLRTQADVEAVTLERKPLANNHRDDTGPFDIIGDVHGCYDELVELLERLGYAVTARGAHHPGGRRAIFVGDLVDRGPRIVDVLRLVMTMVVSGDALCLPGNHDARLRRKLKGGDVDVTHGLAESLEQLGREPPQFARRVAGFIDGLPSHYVFDHGELVVAHAGMRRDLQGRVGSAVRNFALYGDTSGEVDEFGIHVRHNWAAGYHGRALVVYGHTPVVEPAWERNTVNIDTGCVFGGKLSALRYPEREIVSVPAKGEYARSLRPL